MKDENEKAVKIKKFKKMDTCLGTHFDRLKYSPNGNYVAFYNAKNVAIVKTKELLFIPKKNKNFIDINCRFGCIVDNYLHNKEYWILISRIHNKMDGTGTIELICEKGDSSGTLITNRIQMKFDKHTHITYTSDGLHAVIWNSQTCELALRKLFDSTITGITKNNDKCKNLFKSSDYSTLLCKDDER